MKIHTQIGPIIGSSIESNATSVAGARAAAHREHREAYAELCESKGEQQQQVVSGDLQWMRERQTRSTR